MLSIGQAHHNCAARRTTNSIEVISNGLNGSAPLNRVGEFQRFSHNDSLKAEMILISLGETKSAEVVTASPFFALRHSSHSPTVPASGDIHNHLQCHFQTAQKSRVITPGPCADEPVYRLTFPAQEGSNAHQLAPGAQP